MKSTRVVIALALTAAAVRLLPLHFLHPLNWDEIEFWRATSWIAQGRMPFRDFWEHHTPLTWFLFAPVTLLSKSPGVDAVILLRWAQIPLWILTFWLTNVWMRNAGLDRFARWAAMALALSSSLFMLPAVEYRVEALGCALLMGGLVLAQREKYVLAGVVFCLAGFANLRLGPVLVIAVLALLVAKKLRAWPIILGGGITLIAALAVCYANGMLEPLYEQVWADNLAERYATPVLNAFVHRLLVPFGVRILATDRFFELAAVDAGGIAVLVFGLIGFFVALFRRSPVVLIAVLQLANLFFIASMKFIYNYHFALAVILMIPLIAIVLERRALSPSFVVAIVILAWSVNAFASIFRGKELDRMHQDTIMRAAHARTRPGDAVFSGIPWALQREPAYRFWFLPELARQLVRNGQAPKYNPWDNPPAAVVVDYNVLQWISSVQRELAPFFTRHYIPVWRELWVPALNGRVRAGTTVQWVVPRAGTYRIYGSYILARHPWFRTPWAAATYKKPDAARLTFELPPPGAPPELQLNVTGDVVQLRRGQTIIATNTSPEDMAVILLSTDDRVLFRQPPPGVTLEGETTRVTHIPSFR